MKALLEPIEQGRLGLAQINARDADLRKSKVLPPGSDLV